MYLEISRGCQLPGCEPSSWQLTAVSKGAIASPKTYESNLIHLDFAQFEKQHSRYEAILPSIVYLISLKVVNP